MPLVNVANLLASNPAFQGAMQNVNASAFLRMPFNIGDPLLRRPRHQGTIDLVYKTGRVTAFGDVLMRSRALDVDPSFGASGGLFYSRGYTVANAGVSVRAARGVDVYARVLNIADRAYEKRRRLDDRDAEIAITVTAKHIPGRLFEPLPQRCFVRQHIVHAANGLQRRLARRTRVVGAGRCRRSRGVGHCRFHASALSAIDFAAGRRLDVAGSPP